MNATWKERFLEMYVSKTKELVLGARKQAFVPVEVNNKPIEVVFNFKSLRTHINNNLSFSDTIYIYHSDACTSSAS